MSMSSTSSIAPRKRRRCINCENESLPCTPSFVPYLVSQMHVYREGPDVLLERAKDLRGSKAVERYRRLRAELLADDARSEDAIAELQAAADSVASSLGKDRQELQLFQHVTVEVLPEAVGVVSGALVGTLAAGPVGTVVGGLAGIVGRE